ncbi:MAG: B12-binding domain-containing radical SAM protein [Verrucomicrobia bacterium]|nr:B12-binding domain-containing radical SAM protein [Verrucomicrobiota bacterium]
MKIKLISPRSTMRPMDSLWKTHMSPPLSLLVLGALTPAEHDVRIEDENVENVRLDDSPDLVGITVKVDTMQRAAGIASSYRRRGIPVVMGGIHPTACPDECSGHAEAVVVGEAERIWPQLLEDARAGQLRRIYRNTAPISQTEVPVPRWDLIREKNYLFTNTLTIGRGCPWRCDFCYNSSENIDASYRMKPIANIVGEIRSLGIRHVMFIDDNFIGNPLKAKAVIRELAKLNIVWHTAVSADIGNHEDILDLMAESGCKTLFIGFESVNQNNLLGCHKKQNTVEEYDRTIAKIHARGIMVNASLVFGFDKDDASVFPATLDWLVGNRIATMTAHILTPYPGTMLHKRLLAEGRIIDHDLAHYNTAHAVFRPKLMTTDELEHGYLGMYDHFYSWANILRRWPVTANQATAYLEFNLLYRKFGHALSSLGRTVGMRNLAKLAKAIAYPNHHGTSLFGKIAPALIHPAATKLAHALPLARRGAA